MGLFDSIFNIFEDTLDSGFNVAVAPLAPFVKVAENYEGTHFDRPPGPVVRAPAADRYLAPSNDYVNEQGQLGHYDLTWGDGLVTTWVPHEDVWIYPETALGPRRSELQPVLPGVLTGAKMDDDWFDYDFDSGGGGDESWGVNPISVDGAISSAMGGVGGLLGGGGGGGSIMPAMGVMPILGAAAAGAVSLGARLAGMFGKASGSFVINGVKGSMASLWPMVRKYGPAAVAGALGIGAASLAELLMRAPTTPRHRRRGISSRDIRTTKRVVRFTNRMARTIGCVSRPRARYRPRGGGRHYH